jgi:hypothetical protein
MVSASDAPAGTVHSVLTSATVADVAAGVRETHERKIAVHLFVVTVSGTLAKSVKQLAGQMQRTVGVDAD